jgi:hypothetical protein
MRNKSFLSILLVALMIAEPVKANEYSNSKFISEHIESKMNKSRADSIKVRLNDIEAMDKTKLTKVETRNLRKEVKAMNKELVNGSGGIYLSVGAVLLVILLLIILI